MGDAGEHDAFHAVGIHTIGCLLDDGARGIQDKGRTGVDDHTVVAGHLDGAQLQHAGTVGRKLKHLVVGEALEAVGFGADARVGSVNAVDVGVDLAVVGADGGGQCHGRGVGSAAPQRGDLALGVDPLKTGDDHHIAVVEVAFEAIHAHDAVDLGLGVGVVGNDAHLGTGMAHRRDAQGLHGHGEHSHRDLLAGGEEHVHLTGRRVGVDGVGKVEQIVGVVPHGRHHTDHLVARLVTAHQARGDVFDALGGGNGAATELCDDEGHAQTFLAGKNSLLSIRTQMSRRSVLGHRTHETGRWNSL